MIAGAGFAQMAWRLAQARKRPGEWPSPHPPFERAELAPGRKPASTEYYRIIDEAADVITLGKLCQTCLAIGKRNYHL